MDQWDVTLASYDTTAAVYAERNWSTRLLRQMAAFEAMLPGPRVLDVGCGPGRDLEWLAERGHQATGIDLSAGMLREARRRLPVARLIHGDTRRLPFPPGSLDGIWSCSVFVHLDRADSRVALAEIARVLCPGGALYLGLEEGIEPEWRLDTHAGRRYFHFRQADELAADIETAGLRVADQYIEPVGPYRFLTTHAVRF